MNLKKMRRTLFALSFLTLGFNSLLAQSIDIKTGNNDDEKVKVTVGGRVYLDGAVYLDNKTPVGNGASIPDTRLSLKAAYKKWDFKIDMGFNDKKANPKDLHIRYNFNKYSWIRFGHFGTQFGNEGWETSAWQRFVAPAPSDQIFSIGRKIGTTYINGDEKRYFSVGAFLDSDALSNSKGGNQGYILISKFTYSPIHKDGNIFHIGVSGYYRTGDRNGFDDNNRTKHVLSLSSNLISKVSKLKCIGVNIDNVDFQGTYVADFLAATGPVFLQGEYYHTNIKRRQGLDSFQGNGFYAMGGFLLLGEKSFGYNMGERKLGHPKTKALELIVRYDYTDLNDGHGQGLIKGGRLSSIGAGFNYYMNKYLCLKINYSYLALGKHNILSATGEKENLHTIQGRFMVIF